MQTLSEAQLADLTASSFLLEGSLRKPKVLLDSQGYIQKFFYPPKRKLSSRSLFPQHKQFAFNSLKLLMRGVPTLSVSQCMLTGDNSVNLVKYKAIEGKTFRQHLADTNPEELSRITDILTDLHNKGVFFRAFHLGNILLCPDDSYALIDISDCAFSASKLDIFRRTRNLAHLLNNKDDRVHYNRFGTDRFVRDYIEKAKLNRFQRWVFSTYLKLKDIHAS